MKPIYIIKDGKIYQLINDKEAVEIIIEDGVATKGKEKVKYEKSDFLYTFFEIKAKFSDLFETNEEAFENEEFEEVIKEKDKTIAELKARVKELENIVENLTKELEEIKLSNDKTPEENNGEKENGEESNDKTPEEK